MFATCRTLLVVSIVSLSLAACGGGGGGGGDDGNTAPTLLSRTLTANPTLTGWVNESLAVPVASLAAPYVETGFFGTSVIKSIITFNLPSDIDPATIQSASLFVNQIPPTGMPYAKYGPMRWQLVDVGAALDLADHSSGALVSPIPSFIDDEMPGIHEVPMTGVVVSRMNASATTFSVRTYFTGAGTNGQIDTAKLDWNGGLAFELRIDYMP